MDAEKILSRQEGETDIQYHKRLLEAKLIDKTLDLDYSTLSPYLYGRSYSSDVARRMAYGSMKTLDLLSQDDMLEEPSMISFTETDIDEKINELKRERQKYYDQRREYNKIIAAEGRTEHLYSHLIDAASKLSETVGVAYDEEFIKTIRANDCPVIENEHNEAVLVLSDWHYGMVANNVFNYYNTNVCRQRVKDVIRAASQRITLHNCPKLHIVILGDLFHGAIHTSARVASEELVCDQIMEVAEILAQSIIILSQSSPCVKETHVYMTYGNHGRTVANKNDSIHSDNLERIIPWWLEQRLYSYENITVEEDTGSEFLFLNVAGHDVCASHGDLDSIKSSPRLLATLFHKQFNKNIEYVLLGDKHHRESFEELGITSMICGALCGADDYASDKRLYSTPSQMLLIINDKLGLDAEYRILCN